MLGRYRAFACISKIERVEHSSLCLQMGVQSLVSIPGVLGIVSAVLSFCELVCVCFVWQGGSVFIFVFPSHYGWHILFAPLVLFVFLYSLFIVFSILMDHDVINTYGKQIGLITYGVCMLALIVAGVFISWYASKSSKEQYFMKSRYIAAAVFNWINFLVYLALFVLTMLFQ